MTMVIIGDGGGGGGDDSNGGNVGGDDGNGGNVAAVVAVVADSVVQLVMVTERKTGDAHVYSTRECDRVRLRGRGCVCSSVTLYATRDKW